MLANGDVLSEVVLQKAISGDEKVVGDILEMLDPVLQTTTNAEFKSRADYSREDVVNELKMHVLVNIGSYDPASGSFPTWARAVAKNYVRTRTRFLNRAKRKPPSLLSIDAPVDWEQSPNLMNWIDTQLPPVDKQVRLDEKKAAVASAIISLSDDERDAILMRYYNQESIADIAAALGRTPKAVESLLLRSKRKLVSYLGSASRYFSSS